MITASTPTVVTPTAATYDSWWIYRMGITPRSGQGIADARIELRKCRKLPDGSVEFGPDAPVIVTVQDVVGTAGIRALAGLPALAAALQAVEVATKEIGTETNLL